MGNHRWSLALLVAFACLLLAAPSALAAYADTGSVNNEGQPGGGGGGSGTVYYWELDNIDHNPVWPTAGDRCPSGTRVIRADEDPFSSKNCFDAPNGESQAGNRGNYSTYWSYKIGYEPCLGAADRAKYTTSTSGIAKPDGQKFDRLWYQNDYRFWSSDGGDADAYTPISTASACPLWKATRSSFQFSSSSKWHEIHWWTPAPDGTTKSVEKVTIAWNIKLWKYEHGNPNSADNRQPFFQRRVGMFDTGGNSDPDAASREANRTRSTRDAYWYQTARYDDSPLQRYRWSSARQYGGPVARYDREPGSVDYASCAARYRSAQNFRRAVGGTLNDVWGVQQNQSIFEAEGMSAADLRAGRSPQNTLRHRRLLTPSEATSCYWEFSDWADAEGGVANLRSIEADDKWQEYTSGADGQAGQKRVPRAAELAVRIDSNFPFSGNSRSFFTYQVSAGRGTTLAGLIVALDERERIMYQSFAVFNDKRMRCEPAPGEDANCNPTGGCPDEGCPDEGSSGIPVPTAEAKVEVPETTITGVQTPVSVTTSLSGSPSYLPEQSMWVFRHRLRHYTPQGGYNGAARDPELALPDRSDLTYYNNARCNAGGARPDLAELYGLNYIRYSTGFRCLSKGDSLDRGLEDTGDSALPAGYGFLADTAQAPIPNASRTGQVATADGPIETGTFTGTSYFSRLGLSWLRPTRINPCSFSSGTVVGAPTPAGTDVIDENCLPTARNAYDDFIIANSFYEARRAVEEPTSAAQLRDGAGRRTETLRCGNGRKVPANLETSFDSLPASEQRPHANDGDECADPWVSVINYDRGPHYATGYFLQHRDVEDGRLGLRGYAHPYLLVQRPDGSSAGSQDALFDLSFLHDRVKNETIASRTSANPATGRHEFYACKRGRKPGSYAFSQSASGTGGYDADGAKESDKLGDEGCYQRTYSWQWNGTCYPYQPENNSGVATGATYTGGPTRGRRPSTWRGSSGHVRYPAVGATDATNVASGGYDPATGGNVRYSFEGDSPRDDAAGRCNIQVTYASYINDSWYGWRVWDWSWRRQGCQRASTLGISAAEWDGGNTAAMRAKMTASPDAIANGWRQGPRQQNNGARGDFPVVTCDFPAPTTADPDRTLRGVRDGTWYKTKWTHVWPDTSTVFAAGGVCGGPRTDVIGSKGVGTGGGSQYVDGEGNATTASDPGRIQYDTGGDTVDINPGTTTSTSYVGSADLVSPNGAAPSHALMPWYKACQFKKTIVGYYQAQSNLECGGTLSAQCGQWVVRTPQGPGYNDRLPYVHPQHDEQSANASETLFTPAIGRQLLARIPGHNQSIDSDSNGQYVMVGQFRDGRGYGGDQLEWRMSADHIMLRSSIFNWESYLRRTTTQTYPIRVYNPRGTN